MSALWQAGESLDVALDACGVCRQTHTCTAQRGVAGVVCPRCHHIMTWQTPFWTKKGSTQVVVCTWAQATAHCRDTVLTRWQWPLNDPWCATMCTTHGARVLLQQLLHMSTLAVYLLPAAVPVQSQAWQPARMCKERPVIVPRALLVCQLTSC